MTAITTRLAAIACTLILSATVVLGAVAPAHVAPETSIARQIA